MLSPVLNDAIIIPKLIFLLGMNRAMPWIAKRQELKRNGDKIIYHSVELRGAERIHRYRSTVKIMAILFSRMDLNLALQIALSFFFRKLFDSVSQHGARHFFIVRFQEAFFRLQMALADFAQHPAGGFMNQILPVKKQHF